MRSTIRMSSCSSSRVLHSIKQHQCHCALLLTRSPSEMQTSTLNDMLLMRSLASVWHPCTQMKQHETVPLIPLTYAKGCWLHDFDGHRYLDAVSSWWVNLFGHANERINGALRKQLEELEHAMLAGF